MDDQAPIIEIDNEIKLINKDENNKLNSKSSLEQEKSSIKSNHLLLSEKKNISVNQKESVNEQKKRHRTGKFESNARNFKCPECQKTYLSSSALKNHRRMKHQFGIDAEKKGRGRPKKEFIENDYIKIMKEKYENFFGSSEKKIKDKVNKINVDFIKNIFNDLFAKYKNELFNTIDNVETNRFYNLVINNWEKDDNNLEQKSYSSMINCIKGEEILNKPPIDTIFYLYMKYLLNKVNQEYFSFGIKYLIIFREYINKEKKESINNKYTNENKKEYTQIYNGEIIPDLFNDFLIDFMESNNYFNLDKDEVIKLIEYFCFWLNSEGYTDTHILKIE